MHVFDFDEDEFRSVVRSLNPKAPIFPIAATKGEGVSAWTDWLAERIEAAKAAGMAKADKSASAPQLPSQ
jgi:hydrogenase nickel incorporation protein HypB